MHRPLPSAGLFQNIPVEPRVLAALRYAVLPYDPNWLVIFRELAIRMCQALGPTALRINHIGSTSIAGLDAKPVIDLQISVASLEPVDSFRIPLENLGFVFRANNQS